jgi:ribosomal protein S11
MLKQQVDIEKNKKQKFLFLTVQNKKRANIHLRKNYSNFFLTLTDTQNKVIVCKSAAMVLGKLQRRRRRKAPQTMENMVANLEHYFSFYNIKCLYLILHIRPGLYVRFLARSLKARKIQLLNIKYKRKLPYSYTRGRRKKF